MSFSKEQAVIYYIYRGRPIIFSEKRIQDYCKMTPSENQALESEQDVSSQINSKS